MSTHETETNVSGSSQRSETQKPQFFCRYCSQWKFEIDKLPTSRQGNYICAECEDIRQAAIARNTAKNKPWNQHD